MKSLSYNTIARCKEQTVSTGFEPAMYTAGLHFFSGNCYRVLAAEGKHKVYRKEELESNGTEQSKVALRKNYRFGKFMHSFSYPLIPFRGCGGLETIPALRDRH